MVKGFGFEGLDMNHDMAKGSIQEDQLHAFDTEVPGGVEDGLLQDGELTIVKQVEVGHCKGHPNCNMEERAGGEQGVSVDEQLVHKAETAVGGYPCSNWTAHGDSWMDVASWKGSDGHSWYR